MNSSGSRRLGHIIDILWYAGSGSETLMILLALLAVTLGVAGVFPQQPPGMQGAAAGRWLASTAANYPGTAQLLRQLGAFTVVEGPWLRILLAALAFNLALRLAIQASAMAQLMRRRRNSSTSENADSTSRPSIPATAGPLLAYAGMLVLLGGLLLDSFAGWRATEIALAPGSSSALGQTGAPWLSLEELTGSEGYPIARIGLSSNESEKPTSAGQVAVGRPTRRDSLWIALRSAGLALRATAKDGRGRPLLLQSLEPGLLQGEVSEEIHLLFRQTQADQEFALPSANLSFRVVSYPSLPEKGIETPVFLLEAYQGNDPAPVLSDLVVDKAILVLNGSTLNLARDRYAIVDAAFLPGLMPFFLGALAIVVGVVLSLYSHLRPGSRAEAGSRDVAPRSSTEESLGKATPEPNHAP
jgi:hypothetical protein